MLLTILCIFCVAYIPSGIVYRLQFPHQDDTEIYLYYGNVTDIVCLVTRDNNLYNQPIYDWYESIHERLDSKETSKQHPAQSFCNVLSFDQIGDSQYGQVTTLNQIYKLKYLGDVLGILHYDEYNVFYCNLICTYLNDILYCKFDKVLPTCQLSPYGRIVIISRLAVKRNIVTSSNVIHVYFEGMMDDYLHDTDRFDHLLNDTYFVHV